MARPDDDDCDGGCWTALWASICRSTSWAWNVIRDVFMDRGVVRLSVEETRVQSSVRPYFSDYSTDDL